MSDDLNHKKPANKLIYFLYGILLILFAGIAFFAVQQFNQTGQNPESKITRLPTITACALHEQACSVTLPNREIVSLEFSPRPIPQLKPFQITLKTQNTASQPENIQIRFEGEEMYMGFLQFPLKPKKTTQLENREYQFSGTGVLSICTLKKMVWIAFLEMEMNGIRYEIPFRFETIKN